MIKKVIVLVVVSLMFLTPSLAFAKSDQSSTQEKHYPTKEEITLINQALDKMVNEANKQLKSGKTKIVLKEKVGKETIELGFEVKDVSSTNLINSNYLTTSNVQPLAYSKPSGSRIYYAYVKNTAGWNFKHELAGEFVYSGGKITGATKDPNLTGAMYSESHRTWIDKLDPSVWEVHSHGTFKALKYLAEYNTYLTVKLLGSGHYRITRADIGF